MSAPPVPPRPYGATNNERNDSLPPPLPPLPPALRVQVEKAITPSRYELDQPPHFENPLIAPRPHRLDASIPANMARNLDDQIYNQQQQQQQQYQPPPPAANYAPGYLLQTPVQPPNTNWSPWGQKIPAAVSTSYPNQADVSQSIANLSLVSSPIPAAPPPSASAPQSTYPQLPPPAQRPLQQQQPATTSPSPSIPSLTATLPQLSQLQSAANVIQNPAHDPALRIAWCRDIFFLVERQRHDATTPNTDPIIGPVQIADPTLTRLAHTAVQIVLHLAGSHTPAQGNKMPIYIAEAIAIRANLASTGAFPDHIRHNPRTAFRDFETAARGGYANAWFRLGRDYENFNDHSHARECFERGAKFGVESCLYRMGMAHLLGQLSLPSSNPTLALPLLHRAATLASLDVPQPAYVYALLLLAEFTQITLPPSLFAPFIPPNSSPTLEARKHLERAAYLHFAAAQYKLGHAYEFAEPPFPFDPLLSVQYYSLASQQGEVEADMALSKWFLCGSGGAAGPGGPSGDPAVGGFEKDEGLALTFAEKAARKGLPSAEFAMGYYAEVGVGRGKDLKEAMVWYQMAADHGNPDATARLAALAAPSAQTLSRQEHDTITESKLVRRRTLAAQRAETQPLSPPWEGKTFPTIREHEILHQQQQPPQRSDGRVVVDIIRKNSASAGGYAGQPPSLAPVGSGGYGGPSAGRLAAPAEYQRPAQGRYQRDPAGAGRTSSPQQQQQRLESPGGGLAGRRNESPGRPQGGRPPSPGRDRLPRPDQPTTPTPLPTANTSFNSGGSPGRPSVEPNPSGGGSKLQRMRLNLDDPGPVAPPVKAGQAEAPSITPRPPQPSTTPGQTTPPGSGKPQTFAEMGIQSGKLEGKECIIM